MKGSALLIVISIILPNLIIGEPIDPSAKLAEWDGGFITVADYQERWQRMAPKERPELKSIEDKEKFLDNLIAARFLIAGAESARLDTLPNIREWFAKRRVSMLKSALEKQAIEPNAIVDSAEIDQILNRRTIEIEARHIVVPTAEIAQAILDSIEAGVPFDQLAIRYSVDAAGPKGGYLGRVKWGDFSELWCEKAFSLSPGEVSDPLMTEKGYVIIKVEDKGEVKLENPDFERRSIAYSLYKQKFVEESTAFRDSLYLAYNVNFNDAALITLATRYAQKLEDLGISSVVVDIDVIPDLGPDEEEMPVVTYEGGSFTLSEVVDMILSFPYPVRPALDNPDALVEFVTRQLNDTLYVAEALRRGLDKSPSFLNEFNKMRERRIAMAFYNQITGVVSVPEDSLMSYYNRNKEKFRVPEGWVASKIVVGTREAADSMLTRIKAGEPFENVATQRSRDRFTAPKGGDMGFSPIGKDPEFDEFIVQLKVGDMGIFRSVEGWVVLWLRERRESRIPEFDEVAGRIKNILLPVYRDSILNDWLQEKRKGLGVKINRDLLSRVEVFSQ